MAQSPRSNENTLRDEGGEEVCLGDRVVVRGVENGVLRYWGAVQFSAGLWAGVELDGPNGKHDGKVGGRRYFTTDEKRGVFVKKAMICKALTLNMRLPAGLERELQKQVETLSNELQDRNEELHRTQEELAVRTREVKLLRTDVELAEESVARERQQREAADTLALKRELSEARAAIAVEAAARQASEKREAYARAEEQRVVARLAAAVEEAGAARHELVVAQQEMAGLRAELAGAEARLRTHGDAAAMHARQAGLVGADVQRLATDLAQARAAALTDAARAEQARLAAAAAERTAQMAAAERDQLRESVRQLEEQLVRAQQRAATAIPEADSTGPLAAALAAAQAQLAATRDELLRTTHRLTAAEAGTAAARSEGASLAAALDRANAETRRVQALLMSNLGAGGKADPAAVPVSVKNKSDNDRPVSPVDAARGEQALEIALAMVAETAAREAGLRAALTASERRAAVLAEDERELRKDLAEMAEELSALQASLTRQREINTSLTKHVQVLLDEDADGV